MSKKPTYTLEIHIQRLKKILEVPVSLCWHCPAQEHKPGCPCIVLGDKEATKRTWLAIKEYESKK